LTAPSPPAVWSDINAPHRVVVTGIGMGDRDHAINPQTVSLADPQDVSWLLAQMAGRHSFSSPSTPERVTFTTDAPQTLTLIEPSSSLVGYTFEANLEPTGQVTATVSGIGDSYRTPRALVLYGRRATEELWTSVGRTTNSFIYAGRGDYTHTEVLTFPPLAEATDLFVTAVVVDNNDDARPMVLEATAGDVTESVTELGPTEGDVLNIVGLTLPQVPAGMDQISVTLRSPSSNGDSLVLVGLNVSYRCAERCHVRINDDPTQYTSVQAAVDAAGPGDLIKVAGVCLGAGEREGLRQQVYLDKTVTIRGGYAIDDWDTPDPEANPTTLDALGRGRVFYITGDPSAGSGQAISPTIEGLCITGGDAAGLGGGWLGYDAGGGVYVNGCDAMLIGNTVISNTADQGGGLYLYESGATLNGNTIRSNTADGSGGGLRLHDSNATLTNNVVADNRANSSGSGLYVNALSAGSAPYLLHNTIARNTGGDGSGIYLTMESDDNFLGMKNTIVVSHTVGIIAESGTWGGMQATLWGSGEWANGTDWEADTSEFGFDTNIWGDPAFVDPDAGDYHIGPSSAAVDAGVDAGVTVDIDGEPRPAGSGYDIGADEYLPPALVVSKRASPDLVQPGAPLAYTIAVTNTGTISLTLTITDTLPAQVTHATGRDTLVWTPPTLTPGDTWTHQFTVTVANDTNGSLTNSVLVWAEEGVTGSASVTVSPARQHVYLPMVMK